MYAHGVCVCIRITKVGMLWYDEGCGIKREKMTRTSRYRRECRKSCQKRVCSPTPPTNATQYHLYINIKPSHLISQPSPAAALTFKKMIQTSIPRDLKFRPNAHGSSTRL